MRSKQTATDHTFIAMGDFLSFDMFLKPQMHLKSKVHLEWYAKKKMLFEVEPCCIDYCNMSSTVPKYT